MVNLTDMEKLGLIFHVEVKRSGRRTYVNLPDTEVKACRIQPGDVLEIQVKGIQRTGEESESGPTS